VSGQRHVLAALYPRGKNPPVPIVQEAGWTLELVCTQRLEEVSFASAADRTPVVQSVVAQCTDRATPAPCFLNDDINYITKGNTNATRVGNMSIPGLLFSDGFPIGSFTVYGLQKGTDQVVKLNDQIITEELNIFVMIHMRIVWVGYARIKERCSCIVRQNLFATVREERSSILYEM
jgi:hypothetical protein